MLNLPRLSIGGSSMRRLECFVYSKYRFSTEQILGVNVHIFSGRKGRTAEAKKKRKGQKHR